jgi:Ca2+-binding EF-hand superfamily protein
MFKENGIQIDNQIIRDLFKNADLDHDEKVTLDEFKELMMNKEALHSKTIIQ